MAVFFKFAMRGIALGALILWAQGASAQEATPPASGDALVRQLLERIERLEAEVSRLKGEQADVRTQTQDLAHSIEETKADVASAAPASGERVGWWDNLSFHGYGEVHFNNTLGQESVADVHRLVLGWNYRFNDRFHFEAELDFEHSFSEPELEFANVHWDITDRVALKVGSLLMPVGMLNQHHEPPLFYSVERPYVERNLIPTTWQETGAGVEGRFGGYTVQAYVTSALDPMRAGSGSGLAANGIRPMRSKSVESSLDDLALTVAQEVRWPSGFRLGGTFYASQLDHSEEGLRDTSIRLYEVHGQYAARGWDLRAEYVWADVGGAAELNRYFGLEGDASVGSSIRGGYAEVAFDWLSLWNRNSRLMHFLRYERFDTQDRVPAGWARNPANDRTLWTTGLALFPAGLDGLAFKVDYERWLDGGGTRKNVFNFGVGWMF